MAPRKPVRKGFKANRTTYTLVFDDPAMDLGDLVVKVRRGTIAERQEFDDCSNADEVMEFFTKIIVEWNVEDDERDPMPLTLEGMKSLEDTTFVAIQRAWLRAGREVSAPLAQPSLDGVPSLEASIPMEPLSKSLAS
jgi:hypothetical protein